jgi:hypothetical protein
MRKKEKLFTAGEEEKERERGIFSVSEFRSTSASFLLSDDLIDTLTRERRKRW